MVPRRPSRRSVFRTQRFADYLAASNGKEQDRIHRPEAVLRTKGHAPAACFLHRVAAHSFCAQRAGSLGRVFLRERRQRHLLRPLQSVAGRAAALGNVLVAGRGGKILFDLAEPASEARKQESSLLSLPRGLRRSDISLSDLQDGLSVVGRIWI